MELYQRHEVGQLPRHGCHIRLYPHQQRNRDHQRGRSQSSTADQGSLPVRHGLAEDRQLPQRPRHNEKKRKAVECDGSQIRADQRTLRGRRTPAKEHHHLRVSAEKNQERRISTPILRGELLTRHLHKRGTSCHPRTDGTATDQRQKDRRASVVKASAMLGMWSFLPPNCNAQRRAVAMRLPKQW